MHAEEESLAAEVNPRVRGLFLKNLADFQTELARVHAGFVPAVPVWAQRKELPMLIFRSLRRVQDVRLRGRELGVSFADMHVSRSVAGRALLDELCGAATVADFYAAAMVVVPLKLLTAITDYLERNQSVYDLPSVALLEATRDELKAQAVWAESAAAAHAETTGERADATFVGRIESLSTDLAEALREHRSRSTEPLRIARRIGNLPRADSVLPAGFRHLEFGPDPIPPENTYAHRERFHAVNFLQEVQAADSCASILFEAPDMPWDFYFDLSRHMWDESRHAAFGEAKLADLRSSAQEAGLSTKAYAMVGSPGTELEFAL